MIKPVKTKAEIRAEINQQIESYLAQGGHVSQHQAGESARVSNAPLPKAPHIERSNAPQERTPLVSEIQAIEARRKRGKGESKPKQRNRGEKKTLLTDDFGEPLRWISE